MRANNGSSFSKNDRVKNVMSYGIDRKRAIRMVRIYWGSLKLSNSGKRILETHLGSGSSEIMEPIVMLGD